MKTIFLPGCICALLLSGGCSSHLIFAEHSHAGLKVQAGGDVLSPYELSLGYRRGVVAAVPKQQPSSSSQDQPASEQGAEATGNSGTPPQGEGGGNDNGNGDQNIVVLEYDPHELMSIYTEFCANIGFDDPIEFHHLIVTGDAAVRLLAEADANLGLRNVLGDLKRCEKTVRAANQENIAEDGG